MKIKMLLCISIFLLLSNIMAAEKIIKIGVYENNPLIFIGEKKKADGFIIEIIEKIAKKEKWEIEYVPCFFEEGLQKLQKNEIDILPLLAFSEERAKLYTYSKENIITNWANVYMKKDSNIKELLDLEGKKIAGLKNDIHIKKLKELGNKFNIDFEILEKNSYREVLELVANKKADAGVVNRFFGMKFAEKYDLQKSNIIFNPVAKYLAFSKKTDKSFIKKIDEDIKKMKENKISIYYMSINKWIEKKVDKNEVLSYSAIIIFVIAILFFIFYFLSRISWVRSNLGMDKVIEEKVSTNILIVTFLIVLFIWFIYSFLDCNINGRVRNYIEYLIPMNSPYKMISRIILSITIFLSGIIIAHVFLRLKKEQNSLKTMARHLEVTINSIGDAVIVTDLNGAITKMNPIAEKLTGWSYKEAKGKEIEEIFNIINAKSRKKVENPVKKVLENGKTMGLTNSTKLISRKGKEYNIADSAAPIKDIDGKILGVILVFHSVNKEYSMIEELKKRRNEAEKSSRVKSNFLANMSHETRTPLNGIMGLTEILRDIEENDEKKGYLDMIYESSLNLLNIVNNILNLTNIEKGRVEIHNKNVNIYDVLNSMILIFKKECEKKNLEFKFKYDKSFPEQIEIDELLLIQIVINLLGNAIKFTKKGYVELIVKDIMNEEIEFTIIDTGIGINERKEKKLYEPFEQGEYYLTKIYGGTGLGLAITKKLVDLMEGKIKLETKENKGTTFRVRLPFKEGVKGKEEKPQKEEEKQFVKGRQLKIISAEDVEINQVILKKIAELQNWDLKKVYNGEELIKELEKKEYDIVLMDIQMPVLNGLDATKILRGNKKYKDLIILGMSAFALPFEIDRAMKSGMNDYLIKPAKREKLIEKVSKLIKEKNEGRI